LFAFFALVCGYKLLMLSKERIQHTYFYFEQYNNADLFPAVCDFCIFNLVYKLKFSLMNDDDDDTLCL